MLVSLLAYALAHSFIPLQQMIYSSPYANAGDNNTSGVNKGGGADVGDEGAERKEQREEAMTEQTEESKQGSGAVA